jgi:hypothetical protein
LYVPQGGIYKLLPVISTVEIEYGDGDDDDDDEDFEALNFINMSMLKPLWEGIWMGIFGLLIAYGLKKKINFARTLGIVWGIMWLINAAIQGGYEMLILGWPSVCVQTYLFLILGLISLPSLLIAREEFT